MYEDLISVIVPVYNVEKYLQNCLDKIINQTYKNLEIIVLDDGSTDKSSEICDYYEKKDSRIKVIHKKNEGLGITRNRGISNANGKYVCFIDSDDFMDTNMIEKLYLALKHNKADTSYCGYFEYYSNIKYIEHILDVHRDSYEGQEIIDCFLLRMIGNEATEKKDFKFSMSVWHALYSLDIIKEYNICFPSERKYISEDIIFDIDYLSKSRKVCFVKDALYYYRCNNFNSLTQKIAENEFEKIKILINKIEQEIANKTNKANYIEYTDRMFLARIRTYLKKINLGNYSLKNKYLITKRVLNDYQVRKVVNRYPFKYNPIKIKIFNIALKYKMNIIIMLLLKMNSKMG